MAFNRDLLDFIQSLDAFAGNDRITEGQALAPDPKNAADYSVALDIPLGIRERGTFGKAPGWEDVRVTISVAGFSRPTLRAKSEALQDALERHTGPMGGSSLQWAALIAHAWQHTDENEPEYSVMIFDFRLNL